MGRTTRLGLHVTSPGGIYKLKVPKMKFFDLVIFHINLHYCIVYISNATTFGWQVFLLSLYLLLQKKEFTKSCYISSILIQIFLSYSLIKKSFLFALQIYIPFGILYISYRPYYLAYMYIPFERLVPTCWIALLISILRRNEFFLSNIFTWVLFIK